MSWITILGLCSSWPVDEHSMIIVVITIISSFCIIIISIIIQAFSDQGCWIVVLLPQATSVAKANEPPR